MMPAMLEKDSLLLLQILVRYKPRLRLNVQVVPLMSSWHKANTGVLLNEFHAFNDGLLIQFIFQRHKGSYKCYCIPLHQVSLFVVFAFLLYSGEKV